MSTASVRRRDIPPADVRDAPTPEFIEEMRARFPTEREVDKMFTRRMHRRPGVPYAAVSLEQLSDCLRAMLREQGEGDFEVSDARWLAGGASKIQIRCTVASEDTSLDVVVRMEPSESLNASSRLREFELLRALEGVVPVPQTHWVDDEAEWFPEPALVYSMAHGVAKPTGEASGAVSGMGTNFGPELRARLAPQFVEHLARIHTFDHSKAELSSFDRPQVGTTQSAEWQLNRGLRAWEEDRGEDLPIMDVAANWLRRNLPVLDHSSVVHGDYRTGNFLFDEGTNRITTWLDWERTIIGDRHRDLSWSTTRSVGHLAEDGKTFLVCGLMPREEFYEAYEQASGLAVDPARLRWYEILSRFVQVQTVLGTAYRVARLGKSHQDILVARMEGAAYVIAEELRTALEEVI
jgi:aminoglycoside phosphotransferase (APT) family kinase protein